jgi:serine/threonine-protein kinase
MSVYLDSGRRYELCGLLGRGGLGEVLLATDTQLDRRVAIKRLYRDPEATAETAAAAIREARVLASLLHPNVVAVFDIFEFVGDVLVVMEYIPGRTLQEIGDYAPVTVEDFLTIATQSLLGLAAAHDVEMLHLDIKPSNIMVSPGPSGKWKVKVLDFGLAQLLQTNHLRTPDDEERELLGSIFTMAPEQFDEEKLGPYTDLYSLGCVLYFILTGGYPFVGESVEMVVSAHLTHTLIPIGEARPDLPPAVADWIMKLIERDPANRPQSAYAALDLLRVASAPQPA